MVRESGSTLDQLSEAIQSVGETVGRSTVAVRIQRPGPVASPAYRGDSVIASAGSGVVFRDDGLVVTAAHVVALADRINVVLPDGESVEAEVVGVDGPTDLALLQLPLTGLTALATAPEGDAAPGRIVVAVGRPPGFDIALTVGVISASERSIRNTVGGLVENVIQASVPIGPGTSGGALADVQGRLVGINTAAAELAWGLSFAIPVETMAWVAPALLQQGFVRRAGLGITGETVRLPRSTESPDGFQTGVAVKALRSGSTAAKTGLREGDVLLRVNAQPVVRLGILHRLLGTLDEGCDSVCVNVLRNGAIVSFNVPVESTDSKSQRR